MSITRNRWVKTCLLLTFLFFFLAGSAELFAQTTLTTSGDWTTATNWSPNDVPNTITEDASLNSAKNVTLQSPNNIVAGNVTATNNNTITIATGATLTLGASGTPKSLTFSNSGTLTVNGTLEIWGDLVVNNTLTLSVTGNLIIHGNIIMNNGGDLNISGTGTITVGGSVNGGNNTHITTAGGGTMSIGGDLNLGGGTSSIGGVDNSITVGGSCTCAGCTGSVCPANILPVLIAYFNVALVPEGVLINWATEVEENFDHFEVLRSGTDFTFQSIASLQGAGYNTETVTKYSTVDSNPLVGANYYSLKAVDLDGSHETFGIKYISVTGKKALRVYPNPVNGKTLSFNINFEPGQYDRVIVYDKLGTQLFSLPVNGTENEITLDGSLRPGVYVLKYASSGFETATRFIVTD